MDPFNFSFTALFIFLIVMWVKRALKAFQSSGTAVPRHLQQHRSAFVGLQLILPLYLREAFVQAALSYIACNGEGEFDCKDNDCWCRCEPKFPQCNCPYMDIQAMEESLQRITETWEALYKDFEESGKKLSGG